MDARFDVDTLLAQGGWLRALARQLARDDADADDLVQDTFVAAMEHPPGRVDEPGSLRNWLGTALRNFARAERRRERDRGHHESRAARRESVEDDAGLDQVRLQHALAAAILDLPDPYRKTITQRFVDGLSPREIAAAHGISYEAARQRLARGMALLRARLDRDCGGRQVWSVLVLALPRDVAPIPLTLVPKVLAVSLPAKLLVSSAIVAIALCVWLALDHEHAQPLQPNGALSPDVTALSGAGRATDPGAPAAPAAERAAITADSSRGAAAARDAERVLTGLVVDPRNEPVGGAHIRALRNPAVGYEDLDASRSRNETVAAETTSDEDGRFEIELEPGRPFAIEARASPFATTRLPQRRAGEDVLVHLTYGAILAGRVVRKLDQSPVAGAAVRAWPLAEDVRGVTVLDRVQIDLGKTDAGGNFRAVDLAPMRINVDVTPTEESPPMWRAVELVAGETATLEFELESGPTLAGRVVDAITHAPIEGALVGENWTMGRAVRTNAAGEYALRGFPLDGVFEIGARATGYGYRTVPVRAGRTAAIPAELEVALTPARAAHGRILDERGSPVADAYVVGAASVLTGTQLIDWIAARSRADGTFELRDLRPDVSHALHVRHEGHGTVTYEFPPQERELKVIELGDVVLQDMASIRGIVRTPAGEPVRDGMVTLSGWNGDRARFGAPQQADLDSYVAERHTRTDDHGHFVFVDLAAGTYRALTRVQGAHEFSSTSVEVHRAEQVESVEIVLAVGLSIAGRLVGPDGEAVTHCYVSVDPAPGGGATASADVECNSKGRFVASGLSPGTYMLSTWHYVSSDQLDKQKKYAHAEFGPVAAGSTNVVVVLQPESFLRGRVLDRSGQPVPRAVVIATSTRAGFESRRVVADAVGQFEIALPADLDVVLAAGPAQADEKAELDPARSARVESARAGDTMVVLRLP